MSSIKIKDKKIIVIGHSLGITIDDKAVQRHNLKKGDVLSEVVMKTEDKE